MDPRRSTGTGLFARLPRTRGDGPRWARSCARPTRASPHTRGWTPASGVADDGESGFPAHAGMDPASSSPTGPRRRLPRTRGDGPVDRLVDVGQVVASPHTRGWTHMGFDGRVVGTGFPAHAGMDPGCPSGRGARPWLPRTRGDGPAVSDRAVLLDSASPHTRGWTVGAHSIAQDATGFPAHAGMDPRPPRSSGSRHRLPRTRGDGPGAWAERDSCRRASPHTRGWTQGERLHRPACRGFPAHAGMDPGDRSAGAGDRGLPRTRGDGPWTPDGWRSELEASPHTRGWTREP